nr:alginate regulatory protein AlgP [Myxococcales bacterium]
MSPEDTLDIGGTIDEKLASWPAPTRDDAAWGARAEAILAAAQAAPRATDATISSLLEPPRLDPEPGEPGSTNMSGPVRAAGEKLMSQESNPGGGAPSNPGAGPMSAATPTKRPSLKELAARASQAGAARQSIPGASTPPPAASKPISEPPAQRPSMRPSVPSAPSVPPRISDHEHDSGIIDLNKVNSAATPEQVAAAEKAKPAAHDLVGDDDKGEAVAPAKQAAKVASLADAREKQQEKKGNGGTIAGVVIALAAMAAGAAFFLRGSGQPQNNTTAQSGKENPPAAVQAPAAAEPQKIAEAKPEEPKGLSIDSLPAAEAEAQKPATAQPAGGGAQVDSQKLAAAQPAPSAAPAAPAGAGTAPAIGDKPGDLSSAMAKAVGDSGEKAVDTEGAVPANAGKGNQSVPEKPSQGSVNSAIGSVMGGAKSCVAGADDVSRAQITFGSNGSVQNVSVTGWAASNGQSGCVKSALKGASVGPFSQPSFTVGVTIRP